MTAPVEECTQWTVVELHGTLRAPADVALRKKVEALLGRGQRQIVLDLAGLCDIDAAGIGELSAPITRQLPPEVLCESHAREGASGWC